MRLRSQVLMMALLAATAPAVAQKPTDPKAGKQDSLIQFVQAAQRMREKGDYQGALTFYERVLSIDPANLEAIYGTADSMLGLGFAVDSTKYFNRYIQLRPNDARGPIGLARAFNVANRPGEALGALDAARKITGNNLMAIQERGVALDLSGRNKEAQTTFAEGLRLDPKNLDLLRRLALSFAITEDYQTSLSLLQNVANEPGGVVTIRQALAMVYALSGQSDVAAKISATADNEGASKQRLAYFQTVGALTPLQKARVVHFGDVPPELVNQRLAALVSDVPAPKPVEPAVVVNTPKPVPIVPEKPVRPGKPQVVAMPQPEGDMPSVSMGDQTVQPVSATAPVRATPLSAADRFWVQLAASSNRAKILQDWNRAAQNSNGGLSGYAPYLQSDMINYQPILRLVVGGFFDASTAQAMIGRLKTLGVAAIMKRNALPADPLFP